MKPSNYKIIGLTGGIASGKSTVSNILKEKGFKVIDADKIARKVIGVGRPAYKEIVNLFGESILDMDKSINRQSLGDIVFSNKSLLKKLNEITHPRIYKEIIKDINNSYQDHKIIFLDIPLLYEELESIRNHKIHFDQVWLVYLDEDIQLERLMKRNCLSREEALKRIKLQIPLEEKKNMANVIIDNNKNCENLNKQIDHLIDRLA